MSERYFALRYLQIRMMLVVAVVLLIVSGCMWFTGIVKGVADPWVKWPFRLAVLSFFFIIYDFIFPALELRMEVKKPRNGRLLSPDHRLEADKVFYSGTLGFVIGVLALLLVIYRLGSTLGIAK